METTLSLILLLPSKLNLHHYSIPLYNPCLCCAVNELKVLYLCATNHLRGKCLQPLQIATKPNCSATTLSSHMNFRKGAKNNDMGRQQKRRQEQSVVLSHAMRLATKGFSQTEPHHPPRSKRLKNDNSQIK